MFLHYVLNEDQESLICRLYKAQVKNQTINDWSLTVENDLKELGISQSNEEIKTLKKEKFAEIVEQIVEERALQFLNSVSLKHTNVLHIVHTKLCMQEYLKSNKVQNIYHSKFIFQARTRMLDCKTNISNEHKNVRTKIIRSTFLNVEKLTPIAQWLANMFLIMMTYLE